MKPLDDLLDACDIIIPLARTNYGGTVIPALRRGVMWHFDDSSSDKGAENWFRDPAFKLSYNRAYTDNGRRIRLTPSINTIAYHGGVGIREPGVPDATLSAEYQHFPYGSTNTGYFGLAITAGEHDQATMPQFTAIVYDTAVLFRACGWGSDQVASRLVGHNEKAIFNPRDNPDRPLLWGKLGRKIDPIGNVARPVLSLNSGRAAVATMLDSPTHPIWQRFL
jgi:hypothetical protein